MGKLKSLDDLVHVVIARDRGVPLEQALTCVAMEPEKYLTNLSRNLDGRLVEAANGDKEQVKEILTDDSRTTNLFEVPEPMIADQYVALVNQKRFAFAHGTFAHRRPKMELSDEEHKKRTSLVLHFGNIRKAIYLGLVAKEPDLKNPDRQSAIDSTHSLDSHGQSLFQGIGLGGLINMLNNSYLVALKLFDERRSEILNQPKLFDLNQPVHMHEWDFPGEMPTGYWQNDKNLGVAAYHLMGEANEVFTSRDDEKIREHLKRNRATPIYFSNIGLSKAVLVFWSEKTNVVDKVLKAYDAQRQKVLGVPSLFSELVFLNLKYFIHKLSK